MSRCRKIDFDGTTIIITPGPDGKRYTKDEKSAAWCKRCRKKLVQKGVLLFDTEPSYYEPLFAWECPCGQIQ